MVNGAVTCTEKREVATGGGGLEFLVGEVTRGIPLLDLMRIGAEQAAVQPLRGGPVHVRNGRGNVVISRSLPGPPPPDPKVVIADAVEPRRRRLSDISDEEIREFASNFEQYYEGDMEAFAAGLKLRTNYRLAFKGRQASRWKAEAIRRGFLKPGRRSK